MFYWHPREHVDHNRYPVYWFSHSYLQWCVRSLCNSRVKPVHGKFRGLIFMCLITYIIVWYIGGSRTPSHIEIFGPGHKFCHSRGPPKAKSITLMPSSPEDTATNDTTTMMATVSTARPTMFHDAAQDKERISIREEKKDQTADDDGNNFIRKCGKLPDVGVTCFVNG